MHVSLFLPYRLTLGNRYENESYLRFFYHRVFDGKYLCKTAPNTDYSTLVQDAYTQFKNDKRGDVADYIPALAKYSPDNYAIVIATVDGQIFSAGNKDALFHSNLSPKYLLWRW